VNAVIKKDSLPAQMNEGATLLQVIQNAAQNPQADIEKMERLMAMYERVEAKRAEAEFSASLSKVQSELRQVATDANNPQTRSRYATYSALDKAVRPVYTAHGFSLSFDTGSDAPQDTVRVVCYVGHAGGHSRTYHVDMPADGKGAKGGDVMTKTHAVGAGMSYGMRYLLKMIFNIAIGEDDDDGNGGIPPVHSAWLEKIAGIADDVEAENVRKELKDAFAGTPPRVLIAAWQSAKKRVAA
jgi:hypothetical protein